MEKYGKINAENKETTMIDFIICEDNNVLSKKYKIIIEKFMMNHDIDYKCKSFSEYDKKWKDYIEKSNCFKIYILDIKTPKGSGLDAARYIREELDDWNSMIIIITSYQEYKYEALGKRLMLVDCINKLDNCDNRLIEAINICLKNYYNKQKSLHFKYKNILYNIEYKDIIKIEKEQDNKRCIITTTYGEFIIPGTLNKIISKLDKRFINCHRSVIINLDQVKSYNRRTNTITFKNNDQTNAISRDKKKEIINYARGIS